MDNEQVLQAKRRVTELMNDNAQGWQIGEHLENIKKLVKKKEFERILLDLGISEDLADKMISSFDLVIDFMKISADSKPNIDNGKFIQAYNQLSSENQYNLADNTSSSEVFKEFLSNEITVDSSVAEYISVLVNFVDISKKSVNGSDKKDNLFRLAEQVDADDDIKKLHFYYSSLPVDHQKFFKQADKKMLHIYRSYSLDVGEVLSKAQEQFKNQGTWSSSAITFEKWFRSWKFSKSKVYEYISQYKYIQEQTKDLDSEGRKKLLEDFESLPAKARSKVAAQSTDEELRQELLTANITSNAQYKQVLEEYNQAKKALKEAEAQKQSVISTNQKLQSQLTDTTQKVSRHQDALLKAETDRHRLESELHDLEENPVTVA